MPTADCLLRDSFQTGVLKIMNRAGEAGVLGLFHGGEKARSVVASFKPSDVRGLEGRKFAVWSYHEKMGWKMKAGDPCKVLLKLREASLFILQPIRNGFAPIGIVDKLIAPKTVLGWSRKGRGFSISLSEGGTFAAYCEGIPSSLRADGKEMSFLYEKGWIHADVPGTRPVRLFLSF
jgi:hypothetical protein